MPKHYYEEDKKRTMDSVGPYKENKYSKYDVENALGKVTDSQEHLSDPKMVKYMKMYLAYKKKKLTQAEGKFAAIEKVGGKMKEVYGGA